MAFFFGMVGLMLWLGLDMVLGAFIAGVFIPIFFIYVGSTEDIEALLSWSVLKLSLQIVGIMILLRIISSMVYLTQLGLKNTLMLAMGDSMPLTFLLAIATIGKEANAISPTEYSVFVIAGMIASVSMMTLIKGVIQYGRVDKAVK